MTAGGMSAASEERTRQVGDATADTIVPAPGADAASLDTLPSDARWERPAAVRVSAGTLIDRFVVLGELGRGAMGVVLAALDPDLERRVAIKLLNAEIGGGSEGARSRLVQEARAMAQLSHPNVVGVYQVGQHDGQVYVAMELVKGRTLRAWLKDEHSVAAILEVFTAAGRGLAAAHAAGIVHRDFKPDNVFVGDDGGVRVGDFGLAGRASSTPTESGEGPGSFSDIALTLTASGSIMGTPAYMSPEQFSSSAVDARSDQFAFCVALHEALHGARPFEGSSLAELSRKVIHGERSPTPSRPGVSSRARRALSRGLQTAPADRYPDMPALLADLHARAWWRHPALLGGIVLGAVAATWATLDDTDPCAESQAIAAELWDAPSRDAVEARFVSSERPHAAQSFARVDETLATYRDAWGRSRRDACEASRVRGAQSDDLFDRRIACLDRRRGEVDALVLAFAQATPEEIDRSVDAVGGLPAVGSCDDAEALMAAIPPPEDLRVRAQVDELRAELDAARAKLELGQYAEAFTLSSPVMAKARELGYPPLVADAGHVAARAAYRSGKIEEAEAPLREALDAAARGHAIEREAELWITLVHLVGVRLGRPDEGLGIERAAHGAIVRAGGGIELEGRLQTNMGLVLQRAGRYADAKVHAERGLALLREARGEDDLSVASAASNLGNVLRDLGDEAGALEHYRHALAVREAVLGPSHPAVATALQAVGTILQEGDPEAALDAFGRALAIMRDTVGDEHPEVAEIHLAIGNLHFVHGDLPRARAAYDEARTRFRAQGDPSSDAFVGTSVNLGNILVDLGELEEGLRMLEDALAQGERILGAEHPSVGLAHEKLARALFTGGDYTRALQEFARAAAIREATLPFDHPDVAESLFNLASVQRMLERYDDARATFARAKESYAAHYGQDHPEVASVHHELGVLSELQGDLAAAQLEYERALAMYREHLPPTEPIIGRVITDLGDLLARQGKRAEALASYDEALKLREVSEGPTSPSLCSALLGRGALLLEEAPDRGLADFERCVALREASDEEPMQLAFARFELAKALVRARTDEARAIGLAREARAQFLTGGDIGAPNVEEIDAWLGRRR